MTVSARKAISSSTNTKPIVLQVVGHGLSSGAAVEVDGHTVNDAANGAFRVLVIDADHFALIGSSGDGIGGATGYVVAYSLPAPIARSWDGDYLSARADPGPILGLQQGKYRLVDVYTKIRSEDIGVSSSSAWASRGVPDSTYRVLNTGDALLTFASPAPVARATDYLEIDFEGTYNLAYSGGPTNISAYLALALDVGGTPFYIPGSSRYLYGQLAAPQWLPIKLRAPFVQTAAGAFNVGLMTASDNGNASLTISLWGSYSLSVKHWRPL